MDKIYVVGLPYHKYAEVKDKIQKGDHIILKKEPHNKYDKNAIGVYWKDNQIGHIKRDCTQLINMNSQYFLEWKGNTCLIIKESSYGEV